MTSQALKAIATEGKTLTPMQRIKVKLDGLVKQMASAIPETMRRYYTPERVQRLFWQEVRRNPTLTKCEPETIASSLMTACQLGIEIGVQGQGWLVPYFNKKKNQYEAQFIIGYKGLIGLARRSGEVQSIETHIVYAKDTFDLKLGINTTVTHSPFLDGDRGEAKLVYGVARFKDGGYHFEWMSMVEVDAIKQRSQARSSGPWVTDLDQMRRKTLIRRMANYLPLSIEFQNALTVEDATAEGKRAVIDGSFVEVDESFELGEEGAAKPEQPQTEKPAAQTDASTLFQDVMAAIEKARAIADKEVAMLQLDDAANLAGELAGDNATSATKAIANARKEIGERVAK